MPKKAIISVFLLALVMMGVGCNKVVEEKRDIADTTSSNTSSVIPEVTAETSTEEAVDTFLEDIKKLSASFKENGIENTYAKTTQVFDVGQIYTFSFGEGKEMYGLNIMSPNYALGIGEGGPFTFTPKEVDFSKNTSVIKGQLQKFAGYDDRNIQSSEKVVTDEKNFYWIFGDFAYVGVEYYTQILTRDSNEIGYLLLVHTPDKEYTDKGRGIIEQTKKDQFVQKILSVIEKTTFGPFDFEKTYVSKEGNITFSYPKEWGDVITTTITDGRYNEQDRLFIEFSEYQDEAKQDLATPFIVIEKFESESTKTPLDGTYFPDSITGPREIGGWLKRSDLVRPSKELVAMLKRIPDSTIFVKPFDGDLDAIQVWEEGIGLRNTFFSQEYIIMAHPTDPSRKITLSGPFLRNIARSIKP